LFLEFAEEYLRILNPILSYPLHLVEFEADRLIRPGLLQSPSFPATHPKKATEQKKVNKLDKRME
jgi:hypothetical protein